MEKTDLEDILLSLRKDLKLNNDRKSAGFTNWAFQRPASSFKKSPWVEPLEPKFDKDQIKLLLNENQIHATEEFWLDRTCKSSKLARLRQIFELMP